MIIQLSDPKILVLLVLFLSHVDAQDIGFGLNFNFINDAVTFFNENLNPFQNSALTNFVRGAFNFGGSSNILGRAASFVNEISCATHKLNFGENLIMVGQRAKGQCLYCCNIRPSIDIGLYFFNKVHPDEGIPLFLETEAGSLRNAGVDNTTKTIIFIHGFSETYPGKSGDTIRNAYLRRPETYNIMLVDWTQLCYFPWYVESSQNVKVVGNHIATFLKFYHESGELPIENVHIIGFSLGAQVAGFIGKELGKNLTIPRITGLDPAFPNFPVEDPQKRLSKSDAEFVDVIHTDGGIFGIPFPIGHADFFPNGGRALQPGCQPSNLVENRLIDQIVACSHVRAWELYAESVSNPKAFPSTKCSRWKEDDFRGCRHKPDAFMGFLASKNTTRGEYFLRTRHSRPYGQPVQDSIK